MASTDIQYRAYPRGSSSGGGEEILIHRELMRVYRLRLPEGGTLVCKELLGPNALKRYQHETGILERVRGVAGVPQLAEGDFPAGMLVLQDAAASPLETLMPPAVGVGQILEFCARLAETVDAVHRAGVAHKNIAPQNVLVCQDLSPFLIDFSLATTFAEERPPFVPLNEIAGSLPYLAPEQTGRTGRSVDQRADLYALGAVFYRLAVGTPPFEDVDPLQLIHDIVATRAVPPAERKEGVPRTFSEIIVRLLEKEPDARYQSAAGVAHDLRRLVLDPRGEFTLGERDFPLRLTPPSRLVGREREMAALADIVVEALEGRGTAVVISGAAGVGKTALVNELRPVVAARRGWFVSGKFDQYRRDPAATATMQALRAVGRLLLAEPEAQLAQYRSRLLASLGGSAGLITASLPEFAAVLGVPPEPMPGNPVEAQARLYRAAHTLLRSVVSPQRPLVLFVDDLQWAGRSSLAFLDDLLSDLRLDGFLLVAAYRDAEVDDRHPLTPLLRRWQGLGSVSLHLRLQNLCAQGVGQLLEEMLRLRPEEGESLARAVSLRTGGNPFDTLEFLNALRNDRILRLGAQGWSWDEVAASSYLGDGDVLEVLSQRLALLPEGASRVLQTIACFGGAVDEEILGMLCGSELRTAVSAALEDGVLVFEQGGAQREGGSVLRFRHDRAHQCVFDAMTKAERLGLHLSIARRLAPLHDLRVLAAEQYLVALEVLEASEVRTAALLFWEGAQDARVSASHPAVARFLEAALSCCRRDPSLWREPVLARLESAWHQALYSVGRFEEGDAVYRFIERRTADPLEMVESACIQIRSLTNRGRQQESVLLGFDLLQRLGFSAPSSDESDFAAGVERLYAWAQGEDAEERPELKDPVLLGAARLLSSMLASAFFSEPVLCFHVQFVAQRLWIEHGPCPSLLCGFAGAPLITMALKDDFSTGWRIMQRALAIGEARGYDVETAWVRHCFALFSSHWGQPLEHSVREAHRAREGLLRGGDLQFACFTFHPSLWALFDSAATLGSFKEELDRALAFTERTGNDFSSPMFLGYRQLWRALAGETDSMGSFNDPSFDEEAYLEGAAAFPMGRVKYHIHRALCAAIFGDDRALAEHVGCAVPLLPYIQGFYKIALGYLLRALALARSLRGASDEERPPLLQALSETQRWLRARAAEMPENFLHLVHFVEAEESWGLGERARAAFSFDAALVAAEQQQRPWHRALITERAGLFFLQSGLERAGRKLLSEARDLYEAWGASAKVEQMEGLFPFLSVAARRRSDGVAGGCVSTDSIDLLAILRASQALSSERTLRGLQCRVEEVLKGTTGATSVRLVLWSEEKKGWFLPPAAGEGAPVPLAEAGSLLPLVPLRYVQRTREPLLVDDAVNDDRFCRDPYLHGVERCSLMLLPISHHGSLRALLVLENTLSRGVFTADRLDSLRLMAGQLAVSLENALLYERLEERVAERTRELSEAQSELVATARQAGMAEIATNVLHNVGNVLNSVNVSAGVVARTVRESKGNGLMRAVELMKERRADLGAFFSEDPRGRLLPEYLEKLAVALAEENEALQGEIAALTKSVDHIKEIVTTQQSYAGASRLIEPVQVTELLEDALRMNEGALSRHQVTVSREFAPVPVVSLDKGRLLQILVNLISNAKHAMDAPGTGSRLTLRVGSAGERLRIQVCDEGEGIAPENLARVFNHGFTTRKGGHGFGLHSCALAAKEMGGSLTAQSAGPGCGATFTLELPLGQ